MENEDPKVTAAACRYILVGLLQRLEQVSPGLWADLQTGISGDREAMLASGQLSPEIDTVVSEAQRILSLCAAL